MPLHAQAEIVDVYRQLGGLDPVPLQAGPWDMSFNGLVVEYDEEQHFNRYRAATLNQESTCQLPWHAAYLGFSSTYEDDCRKCVRREVLDKPADRANVRSCRSARHPRRSGLT